jgi:hypothetical protein
VTVTINHVDLTLKQRHAISVLLPLRDMKIEQIKTFTGTRTIVKTFVRMGRGSTMREWLIQRNGVAIENPTPGKGTPSRSIR